MPRLVSESGNPLGAFTGSDEQLERRITQDYIPNAHHSGFMWNRVRPTFNPWMVREMLSDPRVVLGLWLIKGPILDRTKVTVVSRDKRVSQFVADQINRFWMFSAARVLKAIEWGYSGSEVLYHVDEDGQLAFDDVIDFDSDDVRVYTLRGFKAGLTVRNVVNRWGQKVKQFIGGPKSLVHVHARDKHPHYGLSRCYGCHVAWWEKWTDGGYRDIRRLWFHKNAYDSGMIRHPTGDAKLDTGEVVSWRDVARDIMEKKRTGGVMTLPNTQGGAEGQYEWEYEAPAGYPIPEGLLAYGDILDTEILEGLGIPPEVVESGGGEGFGSSSGRAVPQEAFFSILMELVKGLLIDFDLQVCRFLVRRNFGDVRYQIVPKKLNTEETEQPNPEGAPQAPDLSNPQEQNPSREENEPTALAFPTIYVATAA